MKTNMWRRLFFMPFFFASILNGGGALVNQKADTKIASAPSAQAQKNSYTSTEFYGEPIYGPDKQLLYVVENKSQIHDRKNTLRIRVTGIKKNEAGRKAGRIRVALWNEETKQNYGKEGTRPHRAVSHWAKDVRNDEMIFEISGLMVGEKVSIFAHFDEKNTGTVRRFLGLPRDQYIFSNAENQGKKGPGLSREGFGPPSYEKTLITYTGPGQEVLLPFH